MDSLKPFIGDETLINLLKEDLADALKHPERIGRTLNCVQYDEAMEILQQYEGGFVYVLGKEGQNYCLFLVRIDNTQFYELSVEKNRIKMEKK